MESLCPWESPQYLIFSSNAPSLLYYSNFVAIFAALIFVYILAFKVKESLVTRIFLFSISCFIVWSVIDVLLWASNRSDLVLFYWSLQILLEMLLYASAFYLAYIFIKQKDLDFYNKLILVATILPIVILLPTRYLLPAIDISYCDAVESSLVIFYTYLIEVIFILSILFVCLREIKQREQIEKLAGELQIANEGQANLIHIINHQIKGYLAKARNVFSELLTEPEYGPISESAKPMMTEGLKSLTEGVDFVTDFLNASNIEKGTYKYEMQQFDLKKLIQNVADKQKGAAEEKGLSFELRIEDGDYNIRGDKAQLEQAVRNLIDNS